MAGLSPSELLKPFNKGPLKGKPRIITFADKLKNKQEFELTNGHKVVLAFEQETYNLLIEASKYPSRYQKELQKATFNALKGKSAYKISDFKKTIEFGGKEGGAAGIDAELKTAERINIMLSNTMKAHRFDNGVPIYGKGKLLGNVTSSFKVPGTPKSDLALVDAKGREVVWISYKMLKKEDKNKDPAKAFQQWGGITSSTMQAFPQVQEFIQAVQQRFPKGMTSKETVGFRIKGKNSTLLKMKAVFGDDYAPGAPFGRNNVNFVVQGRLQFNSYSKGYTIGSSNAHVYQNGEHFPNSLDPILIARYNSDRGQFNVKNSRFLIYPYGGITVKEWLN